MISVVSGIVAGLLHVFSGPDHLAAVAPLSANGSRKPWLVGVRWGIGHSSGVIVVGLAALLFRGVLQVELLSSWAERVVGVTLIGIGIWGIRRALKQHVHVHWHSHGGKPHVHIHAHGAGASHSPVTERAHSHTHAAFAVGTLHGLAGSSHFLGVLPALAFPTWQQAVSYLAAYGVGTILAMAGFSGVIGVISRSCALNGTQAYRSCLFGCSSAAVAIGAWWLVMSLRA